MEKTRKQPEKAPNLSQRQFWVVLLSVALMLAVLVIIYLQERSKEWRQRIEQSNHRLDLAQEIISRDLDRVRSDLLFLAALPEVLTASNGDVASHQDVVGVFREFVSTQQVYSQVRLIDRKGMEVVRVDWDGVASRETSAPDLQDKSDRYYVADSLDLQVGEIFTSEFDLNLEQGKIEQPLKPVIRFVTPIATPESEAGQLLVFNYQGASLLRELSGISLPGKTYLVREDGEFLLGPTQAVEWGWLLDHSRQFATEYSGVPLTDIFEATTPILTDFGLFASREIHIAATETASSQRQSLYCLAHIASDDAFRISRQLLYRLLAVGGIMLIPLALITRFWASAMDRREWQNQKIAESETRLRQLSADLVGIQEEERRSLSREIHDSLGQQATAINLDLRMLRSRLGDEPELERLIRESDELLGSLHGFAVRVRPAELDDLGLKEALQSHIWEFESRNNIECDFEFQVSGDEVDSSIAVQVFRVVQEALNNIAKHAGASVASVKLGLDENRRVLQLSVTDDGVGIGVGHNETEQGEEHSRRLGMLGMRERIELLNGEILVETPEEGGTALMIRIPLHDDSGN